MALIKCPECGKEISSQARSCPHCGNPMFQVTKKESSPLKIILTIFGILAGLGLVVALIIFLIWFFIPLK